MAELIDIPLSVLDVSPVQADTTLRAALTRTVELARTADRLGYHRFWVAEHHDNPALAVVAPPVLIAALAAETSQIRVGSGGVILPNHVPLVVAEQFATLEALHPGRIDLGIGRGPGTSNQGTIRALRRGGEPATAEEYGQDVAALMDLLPDGTESAQPWLLSSSTAGAALAAEWGLPLSFAHHIHPQNTLESLALYRARFRPSRWLDRPYVKLSVTTVCAKTDERAAELLAPYRVFASQLVTPGGTRPFARVEEALLHRFTSEQNAALEANFRVQAIGAPDTVVGCLTALRKRYQPDELMLLTPVPELEPLLLSLELVSEAIR